MALYGIYGEGLHYPKSAKHGIDVDFYVPAAGLAVQATHSIAGNAHKREVNNLVKLGQAQPDITRLVIVTKEEQAVIEVNGITIEVIPVWKYECSKTR